LLSIKQLKEILEIANSLGLAQEVTLEVNPQDLVEQYLQLSEVGLNRISVGIESLDENSLNILGRKTSLETLKRALKIIKKFKREKVFKVNCDLINSIPTQTKESALNDIDSLINLSEADHISLYNLSIEEGTYLAKQIKNDLVTLYDEDYQAEILKNSWQLLKKLGFEHYEISNFALDENHRSMHNSLTWELKDYVGLGCSAVSTINNHRITGNLGINNYLKSDNFSTYAFEELERYTLIEEYLMVRLRTKEGIDKQNWLQRFNFEFDLLLNNSIKETILSLTSLYNNSFTSFALTEEGFMLSDAIILKLIDALDVLLDS
jgi:oxygen-independent coproporphyrinogen-3 oxidase